MKDEDEAWFTLNTDAEFLLGAQVTELFTLEAPRNTSGMTTCSNFCSISCMRKLLQKKTKLSILK